MAAVKRRIPKLQLTTLAERWEAHPDIRRQILWEGKLLKWLSAEAVGVPSYAASSLNFDVLKEFFEVWTAKCQKKRTPSLMVCQAQAMGS